MNAAILAVGSEMLTAAKIDTNSLYITGMLNALGVELSEKAIVGDDRARLTASILQLLERVDFLIVSGGLGPTEDDVTRDAVAAAIGRDQTFSEEAMAAIADRFRRMQRPMTENNRRQAYLIGGAEMLPNARGTAPGQWIEHDGRVLMLLPGPPKELQAMWETQCEARMRKRLPPLAMHTLTLRIAGMGESEVDQLIAPVYTRYQNPACTILAGAGDISVHLRARGQSMEEACGLCETVAAAIEPILGNRIYSRDGSDLETAVIRELRQRRRTVALAESCTGGLAAARLTSVPGSSDAILGSLVAYTNRAKVQSLGLTPEFLETNGAVSEVAAKAMAAAARERLGSDYGLSVTGWAGPDGGGADDPVGTVYLGLAKTGFTQARRVVFAGDRDRIRTLAAQSLINLLRLELLS